MSYQIKEIVQIYLMQESITRVEVFRIKTSPKIGIGALALSENIERHKLLSNGNSESLD
jgi:hypothetical protein